MDEEFCLKNYQDDTRGHVKLTCAMHQCLAQDGNQFQVLDSGSCHIHDTFENRHFDSPKYRQNWNVLLLAILRLHGDRVFCSTFTPSMQSTVLYL